LNFTDCIQIGVQRVAHEKGWYKSLAKIPFGDSRYVRVSIWIRKSRVRVRDWIGVFPLSPRKHIAFLQFGNRREWVCGTASLSLVAWCCGDGRLQAARHPVRGRRLVNCRASTGRAMPVALKRRRTFGISSLSLTSRWELNVPTRNNLIGLIYTRRGGGERARENAYFLAANFAQKIFDPFSASREIRSSSPPHVSDYRAPRDEYFHICAWERERERRDYQPSHQPAGRAIDSDKAEAIKKIAKEKAILVIYLFCLRWQWLILRRAGLTSHYARNWWKNAHLLTALRQIKEKYRIIMQQLICMSTRRGGLNFGICFEFPYCCFGWCFCHCSLRSETSPSYFWHLSQMTTDGMLDLSFLG